MHQLVTYALSFVGIPYIWGGSHPAQGYDCSGFIQEVLASVGLDPKGDQTAQMLYEHFLKSGNAVSPSVGALVFYGSKGCSHVAFMIDANRIVEAGGGGSKSIDIQSSVKEGGFCRIRPYDHRKDILAIIRPPYPDWVKYDIC